MSVLETFTNLSKYSSSTILCLSFM
jgi:hypothetical protein